jgi:LysM repeat protein
MRFVYLSLIGAFFYSNSAFAVCDSVGVKKINDKIFVLHKVSKGEGLYSIGRKYKVSATEIQKANAASKSGIQIGQVLMVPYIKPKKNASVINKNAVVKKEQPQTVSSSKINIAQNPVYYTVTKGETMYSVAKKHGIQVADICKWNKIKGNYLAAGQKIIIGYKNAEKKQEVNVLPDGSKPKWEKPTIVLVKEEKPIASQKEEVEIKPIAETLNTLDKPQKQDVKSPDIPDLSKMVWKEIKESGVASWIDDGNMDSETKFALHKVAPVGTVIKLKNPMNGQETLVKVIGKLPDDETEQNVLLKITKSTAEKLGLRDKYFRLDMSYGMEVAKK